MGNFGVHFLCIRGHILVEGTVVTQGIGSVLLKGVQKKGHERSAALVMHTSRCPSRDSRRWARNATVDQSRGEQMACKGPRRRVEFQATPEESKY